MINSLGEEETFAQTIDYVPRHSSEDRLASPSFQKPKLLLAPVNCEVSDWSPWTVCNVTCGTGRITSTRYIIVS